MRSGKLALLAVTTLVAALLIGSLAVQMQAEAAVKSSTPTTSNYGLVKQSCTGYPEARFERHIPLPPKFPPPALSEAGFTISAKSGAKTISRRAETSTTSASLTLSGTLQIWRNLGRLLVEDGELSVGYKTYSVEYGRGVFNTKTKYGVLSIQIRVVDESGKSYVTVLQGRLEPTDMDGVYEVSFKAQMVRLGRVYLLKLDGTLETTAILKTYSISTLGGTWDHTTITIKVEDSPLAVKYTNAVINAINTWNDTLRAFASKYSDYSYLSNIVLKLTDSDEADVKIRFTDEGRFRIGGETQISFKESNIFKNITVTVRVEARYTANIVYVVTLHELGHALGLGHADVMEDLMYPVLTSWKLGSVGISTLDLYGVAQIFAWLPSNSVEGFKVPGIVTLPASIPYEVVKGG